MSSSMPRILIVEDDEFIRESLTELLSEEGYDIVTACEGQEGLDKLRQAGNFALVLLDLMMPVKDGFAFRREQRAEPHLAHIPVIIFSADTSIGHRHPEFEGATLLSKPAELELLLAAISAAITATP